MATKRKKKVSHAGTDADADVEIEETPERERPALDRLTDLRMDITDDGSAVARLLDIMIDEAGGDSDAVHEELVAARMGDDGEAAGADVADQHFDDTPAGSHSV